MKKFFTLLALMACFLGAKAVEITDFTVNYAEKGKSTIGWKADMIQDEWITADEDGLHLYNPEVTENFYDYQLWIFNGADLEVDLEYTIKIVAKVSEGSADVRCRIGDWGGGISGTITVNSTEYQEYTYTGNATTASNGLLVQFGDYVGTVSFKSVTITHEGKEERPVEWIDQLTNGDAETPWTEEQKNIAYNDQENNLYICAWSKEKGRNLDDNDAWNPFPADIEEVDGSHVFVVHGQIADTEGDASAWDNQFWIQSPKQLKVGSQFKLHFRYKASEAATTNTQFHHQNPSDYVHWQAIGDINFTTEWQEYDGVVTVPDAATDAFSIAFNLNAENKNAVNFYFDDISLSFMKLEEGFFVASSNTETGIEYDFDNALKFTEVEGEMNYIATVGTVGKPDTWVNEVMISTVRGNDRAFKANTLKPGADSFGEDAWDNYTEASSAKVKLPAAGVWTITINTEYTMMNFVKLEGEDDREPLEEIPNTTEVVVHGQERDLTADEREIEGLDPVDNPGQPWDNQFFIVANRTLATGEVTIIKFRYKSSIPATSGTQLHGDPGAYLHWGAIGSFTFEEDWQDFETTFTVPSEANNMKSIAFNMAEIQEACDYYITDVVWMLEDMTETLIDTEGAKNFYVKEGAGTDPYIFGTDPSSVNSIANKNVAPAVIYNLAGQRVAKDYKGIVVTKNRKMIVK